MNLFALSHSYSECYQSCPCTCSAWYHGALGNSVLKKAFGIVLEKLLMLLIVQCSRFSSKNGDFEFH